MSCTGPGSHRSPHVLINMAPNAAVLSLLLSAASHHLRPSLYMLCQHLFHHVSPRHSLAISEHLFDDGVHLIPHSRAPPSLFLRASPWNVPILTCRTSARQLFDCVLNRRMSDFPRRVIEQWIDKQRRVHHYVVWTVTTSPP